MRKTILCALVLFLAVSCTSMSETGYAASPVNGSLSAQARQVLDYVDRISGTSTLTGQHDKPGAPTASFNQAKTITGQYPALWGSDLGFASSGSDTMYNRQGIVNEAKNKWAAKSLVTLTWHMCRPDRAAPCSWDGNVYNAPLSSQQWNDIVTPGTALYNQFIARIDEAVPYLQQLRDANVPVLWRPFHEMNGSWFWWGGNAANSKKLYRIMYDRYVYTHGLSNLIWVWNVDRPGNGAPADYYPGSGYVDILSMDIYNGDFNASYYNTMLNLAAGKPIALGEVGDLPTPAQLNSQPKWAYFMAWTEHLTGSNTNAEIQATYWDPRMITQNEVNLSRENIAYNKPAYASSSESASYPASAAFDANGGTRWASAWNPQEWIYVDLGSTRSVSGVRLAWESAYARKYQIQVSGDQVNWTTVYTDETGTGGEKAITFPTATARYVKMFAYERATTYGYSLWEFEVYP